jgi:hypothetical protein
MLKYLQQPSFEAHCTCEYEREYKPMNNGD